MTRFILALALVLLPGLPRVALAEVTREVGQADLRRMVATGQSLSLFRVIDVVARATAGEPVDVRLFDSGGGDRGGLFYRVVVVQPSGQLVSLVMNAQTGEILPDSSPTATRVRAAASNGTSTAEAAAGKTNAKGGLGNSGATEGNGNGGGNGNGSGNGNSGGNGNGGGNGNDGN